MMKRFIAGFLTFSIFLAFTGCSSVPAVSPAPAMTPVPTATSNAEQVFLPYGTVPKASYEPIIQPARYYEDVTKKFIPSKDYGHIWPYVGSMITTKYANTQLLGICDDKGRIICDPVFHYVTQLEKDGAVLYQFITYDVDSSKKRITKIMLARPDGSWGEEYDEIQIHSQSWEYAPTKPAVASREFGWRQSITLDYITVRKGTKWGAVDYNGNVILPCSYSAPLFFSEGLASVVTDDGKGVFFIDKTGNKVLGPYQLPPKYDENDSMRIPPNNGMVFSEGRVHFYKDGNFGVIDKSGKVIIEAKYDYISAYYDGTAKFLNAGKYGVIGLNGEILLEITDKRFDNAGKQTVIFYDDKTYAATYFSLITKETVPKPEEKPQNYKISSSGLTLKTKSGDKFFPGINNVRILTNGNFAIAIPGNNQTWKIIDSEGENIAGPFKGELNYGNKGFLFVILGRAEYSSMRDYNLMAVYNEMGVRLLPGTYLYISPFDGRYIVRTETAAGLLDKDGNWVIRVPLYEFMGD